MDWQHNHQRILCLDLHWEVLLLLSTKFFLPSLFLFWVFGIGSYHAWPQIPASTFQVLGIWVSSTSDSTFLPLKKLFIYLIVFVCLCVHAPTHMCECMNVIVYMWKSADNLLHHFSPSTMCIPESVLRSSARFLLSCLAGPRLFLKMDMLNIIGQVEWYHVYVYVWFNIYAHILFVYKLCQEKQVCLVKRFPQSNKHILLLWYVDGLSLDLVPVGHVLFPAKSFRVRWVAAAKCIAGTVTPHRRECDIVLDKYAH